MGWGGARVGAGRPRKEAGAAKLHGSRQRHRRVVVTGPLPVVTPPADLPEDQRAVWEQLAPHATAARTLTGGTAESFRDLCRAVVIRNGLFAKIQADGWTYITVKVDPDGGSHEEIKRHPLVADLRGWEQRVEAGRARFRLAPMGKEIAPAEPAKDDWSEFDGPHLVKGA